MRKRMSELILSRARFPATLAILMAVLLSACSGQSNSSTAHQEREVVAAASTPTASRPNHPAASAPTPTQPAQGASEASEPRSEQPKSPAATSTATPSRPETSAQTQVSGQPLSSQPASIPAEPREGLERPYVPSRPKLAVPEPGPSYDLDVSIDGWTTYIFAERQGKRHPVVVEETRWLPGMYEKYVTLSPDHRAVTYAKAVKAETDRMRMYLVDTDGGNDRLLVDLPWEFWVARPVWSPDSRRLAYVRTNGPEEKPGIELWVINADGSGHRKLLSHPSFRAEVFYGSDPQPLRWTAYGDLQYKDYKAGRLWTVDGETGELSYEKANLRPPKVDIPVIKTKNPIPMQAQTDPRWRYDIMQPAEDNTLGGYGCALTAVSMSFNAHGIPMDPGRLNKEMGKFAAAFEWGYAAYLSDYKLNISNQQWMFDWYSLDYALKNGWPALVWLADEGAVTTDQTLLTHWVLVVGGGGQTPEGYRIYDPWDGSTWKTLGYYTDKGYFLRRVYAYAPVTTKLEKAGESDRSDGQEKKARKKP